MQLQKDVTCVDGPTAALASRPDFLEDIAIAITATLLPRGFSLRAHKLNVYGPGGHFKPHIDTPTDPRMVGSLVVLLPCAFVGGELIVARDAGGRAAHCNSDSESDDARGGVTAGISGTTFAWDTVFQPGVLPWAAFFGDVVHEVRTVSAGHRISVTYAIVADETPARQCTEGGAWEQILTAPQKRAKRARYGYARPSSATSSLAASLAAVQHGLSEMQPTLESPVGILLSHAYTLRSADDPGALLGCDAALFASLTPLYGTSLVPVVCRRCG